jgi:hypothetical protein
MAIVLKKPLKAKVPDFTTGPSLSPFATLIDEIGEMQAEHDKRAKKIKELQDADKDYGKKLKELVELINTTANDPFEPVTAYGTQFKVEANPCSKSRFITDMQKVGELLGEDVFMQLAKVNITDLDKYMTPPQLEQVTDVKPGSRSKIEIIKRADVK